MNAFSDGDTLEFRSDWDIFTKGDEIEIIEYHPKEDEYTVMIVTCQDDPYLETGVLGIERAVVEKNCVFIHNISNNMHQPFIFSRSKFKKDDEVVLIREFKALHATLPSGSIGKVIKVGMIITSYEVLFKNYHTSLYVNEDYLEKYIPKSLPIKTNNSDLPCGPYNPKCEVVWATTSLTRTVEQCDSHEKYQYCRTHKKEV